MSEEYDQNQTTQYSEPLIAPDEVEMPVISDEDAEIVAMIEERRNRNRRSQVRKKRRMVTAMVLIFAALLTMCSREILRLKAENLSLQRQHAQLEQERDRLTRELERVGDKEYIKEQARKQLKLLDPGEIRFIFEDEKNQSSESEETKEEADE